MRSAQGALRTPLLALKGVQDVADLLLDFGVFVDAGLQGLEDGGGDEGVGHFGGVVRVLWCWLWLWL